jgi:hypothetical protein
MLVWHSVSIYLREAVAKEGSGFRRGRKKVQGSGFGVQVSGRGEEGFGGAARERTGFTGYGKCTGK